MYLRYYGLNEPPFSITPDPRFVHLSERHRDALAHLLFGIDKGGGGGFVQLTGEVGTGKTTLSRLLLEQLPEHARIALVLNPKQNAIELLETICEELRIDIAGKRGSAKGLIDALNAYLLHAYAQGLRVVVLIDEAQNLPADTLEQVRLLTNLETDTQKLLQILLLGQPELRSLLARPELRQLAQRITARFHLQPLDVRETDAYLRHRWRVAGGTRFPFDAKAVQRLHRRSGGVPRLLNVIAERALLAGYARDAVGIDKTLIDLAADEVLPPAMQPHHWRWVAVAAAVAAIATLGFAALQLRGSTDATKPAAPSAVVAASPLDPAAKVPPATVLDAAALVQQITTTGSSPVAGWEHLLRLWKLPATSIAVTPAGGCTPGNRSDVHCVQGRARLEILTALDRPLLLRLQAGNTPAWAVLLGTDARSVRLLLGKREVQVDRRVLLTHWNGDYAALWVGQADVPPTAAEISAFQSARGLPADGVAGSLTLMALANGLPGPHLLRVLE
ncbi:MAG: AAA family ATPase [Xanthomonadaceae bacterium]|nr:AAA family ATPase [Xanthomonadaceae bacterium]